MSIINKIKDTIQHHHNATPNTENSEAIMIDVEKIKKGTPFITMFPIKQDVLAGITQNMQENGYDNSQPVIIWKETNLLIDGHTRSKAAENASIKSIPAIYYSFPDVDSALKYAYGLQFKRRNLDDSDRFSFAEQYLNNVVQSNKKGGWKKKELAEILSVSMGTAQKYLSVINRATDKERDAVKEGSITINTAYNNLLRREGGKIAPNKRTAVVLENVIKEIRSREETKTSNLIQIDTESIKQKVDLWAKDEANRNIIVAISEIVPEESEIAKYIKDILGKEK